MVKDKILEEILFYIFKSSNFIKTSNLWLLSKAYDNLRGDSALDYGSSMQMVNDASNHLEKISNQTMANLIKNESQSSLVRI